jgi:hypothetical protein
MTRSQRYSECWIRLHRCNAPSHAIEWRYVVFKTSYRHVTDGNDPVAARPAQLKPVITVISSLPVIADSDYAKCSGYD